MGSGKDGILHIMAGLRWQPERAVSELEWRQVDFELQLARQRLELQRSSRRSSQFAYFSSPLKKRVWF